MRSSPLVQSRISRRRALSLAAGTAALAVTGAPGRRAAAQATPEAAPAAAASATLPPLPMPSTLAADASLQFRAVTEALMTAMQRFYVPGAAVGLLAGDREEHATLGLESLSSLRPVTPDTLFQIGSISKTFTGTAIWHLIDAGVLELDAPVRTYIPEFTVQDDDAAAKVTVQNLLDHSAGFYGDEGFDTGNGDDALARYVAVRMPQLPQLFPVGEYFSYNNAAFSLLGRLIEVATGTTYEAAMANLLFGPLGLEHTHLDRDAVRRNPFADGHAAVPINGKPAVAVQTPLFMPRAVDPAGGIWSTTRDLIRYARFHLDQGVISSAANIVHPESLAQMREPAIPVPGFPLQMGRDWFVQEVAGRRAFFHGGDTAGQHADLVFIPEEHFALIVLTNGQGGGSPAATAALDVALAQVPALEPLVGKIGLFQTMTAPADAPTVDLTSEQLAAYAGRYADSGQVLTFAQGEAGLELTTELLTEPGVFAMTINPLPAPPAAVSFLAEDMAVAGGQRLPFVRDADGSIGWVASGLRLVPRVATDS